MEVNLRKKDSYDEGSQRSEKCVIACDESTKDDPENRTSKVAHFVCSVTTEDSQGIEESQPSEIDNFLDQSSKKISGSESNQGGSYIYLRKNNKGKEEVEERDEVQGEEKHRTEEEKDEQEKEEQKNACDQLEGEREKQEEVEKEELQEEVEKWERQEQQEEKDDGKEHQSQGRRENQEMPTVGQREATKVDKQKDMGSEIYEEEERKMEQETNKIIVAGEGEKEKNEVETQQKNGKNKTEGREEQQEAPEVAERGDEDCKGKVKEEQEQKGGRQQEEEKQEEKEPEVDEGTYKKTEGCEEQQEALSVAERGDKDCKEKVKEEQEQKGGRQQEEEEPEVDQGTYKKTEGLEEQQEALSVAERGDEDCKGKVKEEQEQKVSRQEEEEKQEEEKQEEEEQEEGRGHEKQKEEIEQGQLPRLRIERDGERARQETRDPKAQTAASRVAGVQPSVSQAAADVQWAKVGVKVIQGKDNSPCQQGGPSLSRRIWGRGNVSFALVPLLLFGSLAWAGLVDLHVEGRGRTLQGEPYSLVCLVTPAPASNTTVYTWMRNNEIMKQQNKQVVSFSPLRKADEGDFSCSVDQGGREKFQLSEPFHLHVTVLENISLVPEVEVEEGQTVILNCSVHSDPTAFLTWYLDKEVVRTVRSNSDSLVLHNASRLHRKVVQCQAYNEALDLGFLNAYTLIRIKGTYEAIPKPYLRPRGVPVLHHPFGMECLLMDVPNSGVNVHLTYTWYKDNAEIEGQFEMILEFPSVTREDTGRYTCTARNGKPLTTSLQSNIFSMQVLLPPMVHIEPRTADNVIHRAAGENLTLTYEVIKAVPGVAVDGYRWRYLPSPQGQLQHLEVNKRILTLGPLTRQDSGQYFCQAWNDELLPPGNASVTVNVVWLGNITVTADLEVNEGETVNLTCSVDCYPAARLTWVVEGQEVRHVTADVDNYVLEGAACSDSKTYTCRASNAALPGLERNASTHVLVNCTENGDQHKDGTESSDTWIAGLVIAVVVLVAIAAAVVLCKLRASSKQTPVDQTAGCWFLHCLGCNQGRRVEIKSPELESLNKNGGNMDAVDPKTISLA